MLLELSVDKDAAVNEGAAARSIGVPPKTKEAEAAGGGVAKQGSMPGENEGFSGQGQRWAPRIRARMCTTP